MWGVIAIATVIIVWAITRSPKTQAIGPGGQTSDPAAVAAGVQLQTAQLAAQNRSNELNAQLIAAENSNATKLALAELQATTAYDIEQSRTAAALEQMRLANEGQIAISSMQMTAYQSNLDLQREMLQEQSAADARRIQADIQRDTLDAINQYNLIASQRRGIFGGRQAGDLQPINMESAAA